MSKTWPHGSTREWRDRTRPYVLNRDQHRCQLHLPGCTIVATEVHHTRPAELVGFHNAEYLVAACRPCNNRAGDPRNADPVPRPCTWW